jgi:hypothetical protein
MTEVMRLDMWEVKLTDFNGKVIAVLTPPIELDTAITVANVMIQNIADDRALAIVQVIEPPAQYIDCAREGCSAKLNADSDRAWKHHFDYDCMGKCPDCGQLLRNHPDY